jgi:hypothetical protein
METSRAFRLFSDCSPEVKKARWERHKRRGHEKSLTRFQLLTRFIWNTDSDESVTLRFR